MKRGDEREGHEVGKGKISGMAKITIKWGGGRGGDCPRLQHCGGTSANVLELTRDRTFNLIQHGASTAFRLGQFELVASYHHNDRQLLPSVSRNHSPRLLLSLWVNKKRP